jgi:parallel beta-helix repeat protein
MNKKKAYLKTISIICIIFASLLFNLVWSNGQQNNSDLISITPDGNIVGTEKIERNGNTYTLQGNIDSMVVIQKDNIVLDGAGFAILGSDKIIKQGDFNQFSGTKNETAISIKDRTNITIKNVSITGYKIGVEIYKSSSIIVSGCRFNQDDNPFYIESSSNNWITNNEITTISFCAFKLQSSDCNFISKNDVQNSSGIIIVYGSNNLIAQNNFTNGDRGISIESSDNQFIANNISNNNFGVILFESSNNLFSKNIITKNSAGINVPEERLIKNVTFSENTFIENNHFVTLGLNAENSYHFYQNNFINNSQTVGFDGEYFYSGDTSPQYTPQLIENHNWDNGTYGNYWSDYKTKYPNAKEDVNNTQTFDTPYVVTPSNYPYLFYDYRPLTSQVIFSQDTIDFSNPTTMLPNQGFPTETIIISTIAVLGVVSLLLLFLKRRKWH